MTDNDSEEETTEIRVLTHEELADRSREIAQAAVDQCPDDASSPFIVFTSLAVLLAAAALLTVVGRIDRTVVMGLLSTLLDAHDKVERESSN